MQNEEWQEKDLEEVNICPICNDTERTLLYEHLTDKVFFTAPGKWNIHQCNKCFSAYLDPRPTLQSIGRAYEFYYTHQMSQNNNSPQKLSIRHLKEKYFNTYKESKYKNDKSFLEYLVNLSMNIFPIQKNREDRLLRNLPIPTKGDKLLDYGCGNGNFIENIRQYGWDVYGIDADPTAVKICQSKNLKVTLSNIQDTSLPDNYFDVITMNHVIEHLHDPWSVLKECHRILKPGGIMWLATPNINSDTHRYFKSKWLALDPPRHLIIYNHKSLKRLFENTNFKIIKLGGAAWEYHIIAASTAMKSGLDPIKYHVYNKSVLLQIRRANIISWLFPERSSEVVIIATK